MGADRSSHESGSLSDREERDDEETNEFVHAGLLLRLYSGTRLDWTLGVKMCGIAALVLLLLLWKL